MEGSPKIQDFFWNLLQKAELETDFMIEEGRVVIEAMPLQNNGITIFLTRPEGLGFTGIGKSKRTRYRVRSKTQKRCSDSFMVYRFDNFDDVCAFASGWRYMGERSSLYALEDTYIMTFSFDKTSFDRVYAEAQIIEFARPCDTLSEAYLEEHAQKICDGDAIASILRYFKN